ncbi:MAG: DNA alkylation repair protein [Actinobacteria bacterium]|nr:DNA alkylation repair protein [Actinomycetota bacterium]
MTVTSNLVADLRNSFVSNADQKVARDAAAYMRNQFEFLGIKTPLRRELSKDLVKKSRDLSERDLILLCKELWAQPEREFQYVACDLLAKNAPRLSAGYVKRVAPWFIKNKSWWDTVDSVRKSIEIVVSANPELEEVTDNWIESKNIWLVRSALIHQLTLGTKTNSERLFRYCEVQATEKEFFIAKGLGWALRSYSNVDPKAVKKFVKGHPELTPLAIREGLKRINR